MNRIKEAFDVISTEESLKQGTIDFLQKERIKREKRVKPVYKYVVTCVMIIAVIFGSGTYGILNTAVSYISIDVNPSVELALNCFDNVVKASAYNDDGTEVLKELDLKGEPYTKAIDSLLENQDFISYFNENDRIDFTVVSDKQDEIIERIQGCHSYGQYNGFCYGADSNLASQAHRHGLSTGKYRAYLELVQYDGTIEPEDCKNMTMQQIYDMIKEKSGNGASQEFYHGHGMKQHNRGNGHNSRHSNKNSIDNN